MSEGAQARLRLWAMWGDEADEQTLKDVLRETGFEYDYSFLGVNGPGFWMDLWLHAAEGGATTAGGIVVAYALKQVVRALKRIKGVVQPTGILRVHAPDRPVVAYELPWRSGYDAAADAIPDDYVGIVETRYTERHWPPDGSRWEVDYESKFYLKRPPEAED